MIFKRPLTKKCQLCICIKSCNNNVISIGKTACRKKTLPLPHWTIYSKICHCFLTMVSIFVQKDFAFLVSWALLVFQYLFIIWMFLFKTLRSNDAFIYFTRVILDLVDSHLWIIASLNGRPCIRRSDFKVCLWILSIFWAQNLSVSLNMSWFFFEILVKTFIHEDLIQFKIQPKFS